MGWYKGGSNCCCVTTPESCLIGEDTFQHVPTTDTGWVTAGTVANTGDGISWSGTTNLAVDDGSYASVTLAVGETSKYLDLSSFGLSVPSSALITGIEVRYRRFASTSFSTLGRIQVLPGSYTLQDPKYISDIYPTAEAEYLVGANNDDWLLILTPEGVNNSSFKVRISVANTSGASVTANIDIVQIKVHYTTTPLSAGWSVQSGTWGMTNFSGNHCASTEDTGAYLRFDTAHPNAVAEHVVLVNLIHCPNVRYPGSFPDYYKHGDKARIVLCTTLFVEIELGFNETSQYTTYGCFIVRLFNGTTLLQESKPMGFPESQSGISLWAGYSATTGVLWTTFSAQEGFGPNPVTMKETVGTVSGTKVGIGTGSVVEGRIIFSDFHYYYHNYGMTITDCYTPGDEITQTCVFTKSPFYYYPGNPLTEIGCGWEIVSGTWIGTDYGYYSTPGADDLETVSTNALIRCTQDQSAWNCIEYTDFGYQKLWVYAAWLDAAGDTTRFYVDYDPTSGNGHWGEITCGNSGGVGSVIKLGKGGTILETVNPPFGPQPPVSGRAAPFQVTLCTFVAEDGTDAVSITVEGFWDYYLPGKNDYLVQAVSYTTVYGNKRVAFGTGATINGKVHFRTGDFSIIGSANANACRDCYPTECTPCPGGDGPQGISFNITGFINEYSQYCGNCPDIDGTYVIPSSWSQFGGSCQGRKRWFICNGPIEFGVLYYYLEIAWEIEEAIPSGWELNVSIIFIPEGTYAPPSCGVLYQKTFSMSQRCDTLVDETIPYESGPLYPGGCLCDGVTSLTIKATAY